MKDFCSFSSMKTKRFLSAVSSIFLRSLVFIMCCIISGEPISDPSGRYRTYNGTSKFQVTMLSAPCASQTACCWFCCQFIECSVCTQWALRRKVLDYDMTKYACFQGYFNCCGCKAGSCGEKNCPDLCLCLESCLCNGWALSASRNYVMEKYNLTSDPCDYRLIRLNNCLQILSCICNFLAMINDGFRGVAKIIDAIASIVYHCVSGCMTAQVVYELEYQKGKPGQVKPEPIVVHAVDNRHHYQAVPSGQPQVVYQQQSPQIVYQQPAQQVVYQQQPAQQVVYQQVPQTVVYQQVPVAYQPAPTMVVQQVPVVYQQQY